MLGWDGECLCSSSRMLRVADTKSPPTEGVVSGLYREIERAANLAEGSVEDMQRTWYMFLPRYFIARPVSALPGRMQAEPALGYDLAWPAGFARRTIGATVRGHWIAN